MKSLLKSEIRDLTVKLSTGLREEAIEIAFCLIFRLGNIASVIHSRFEKKNRPSYFIASSSVLNKTLYYLNLTLHGSHTFSHLILITALGANIFILIFGRRKLNLENLRNSASTSCLVVELASLHFKVHLFADCLDQVSQATQHWWPFRPSCLWL